ncbi:MAG: sigma-54-dependent Fis family transcriptional regulator, partial [Algoriphagus sp. 32-45-6]
IRGLSGEVWDIFYQYDWPGNLRELRNIVKRAVLLSSEDRIEKDALPSELYDHSMMMEKSISISNQPIASPVSANSTQTIPLADYKSHFQEQEKDLILKVLQDTRYNKSKTARILNMDRKTLYSKMEKYGLE